MPFIMIHHHKKTDLKLDKKTILSILICTMISNLCILIVEVYLLPCKSENRVKNFVVQLTQNIFNLPKLETGNFAVLFCFKFVNLLHFSLVDLKIESKKFVVQLTQNNLSLVEGVFIGSTRMHFWRADGVFWQVSKHF